MSHIDYTGEMQVCGYGGDDLESCFEALTVLKKDGWHFTSAELVDVDKKRISLPVEAFDGSDLTKPLKKLQQDWEQVLSIERNN